MALWNTRRDREFWIWRALDLQTLLAGRAEVYYDCMCIPKKLSLYSSPKAVSGPPPTHTPTCTLICLCPYGTWGLSPRCCPGPSCSSMYWWEAMTKNGGKNSKAGSWFSWILKVLVTSSDWEAERKSQRKLKLEEGRGEKEQGSRENIWE